MEGKAITTLICFSVALMFIFTAPLKPSRLRLLGRKSAFIQMKLGKCLKCSLQTSVLGLHG